MCVGWNVAQRVLMATRVHTEALPLLFDGAPAAWVVGVVVAGSRIRNVTRLTDIQSGSVSLAVSGVLAHGLHAELVALINHEG